MADWNAAIIVLENAVDTVPVPSPGMDATLDHVRDLLGSSPKAVAAYAEADRLARQGYVREAAAHLHSARPSPIKWIVLIGAGVAGFTLLMIALPVGAMLWGWRQAGFDPTDPTGGIGGDPSFQEAMSTMAGYSSTASLFFSATSRRDAAAAYELMSPAYRATVPLERFRTTVEANPYLTGARSVQIDEATGVAGSMAASGYLSTEVGTVAVELHFSEVDQHWYIVGVTIAGAPALPSLGGVPR